MADPFNTSSSSLVRLSDADYEIAPGEADVRGWEVCLANDEKIGEVDDLIIDPEAGKVRYLEVALDREAVGLERDRHVLVPIASAQLDTNDEDVVLAGMTRATVLELPEYDGQQSGSGYDQTSQSHASDDLTSASTDRKSQRITRSAEELRIGKRADKTGEVRVSKHVETERVTQSVPLRSEEVRVERRPVEHAVGSAGEMRNDEIVIPIIEEQAIVEKRPVVKEEIIISKEPTTRQRTVEADVRREEVDVQPSSDDVRVRDDRTNRGGE